MMFYFNFMLIFVVLKILIFLTMKSPKSKPKPIPKKIIKFKPGNDLATKVK